jgi:hypothetical protein
MICSFALRESALTDPLLLGSLNLLFGLEPVVELAAGLVAALNVKFVRSAADAFFEGGLLDRWFLCTCGCGHGIHLRRSR